MFLALVESALYFAIGFFAASLLAIIAMPAVSRRAMRLANARARLQAPLSESQARAERDALRAQHAVEIVGLERKAAAAEWDRAVARTELGRQTKRMLQLDDLAHARVGDLAIQAERITKLTADVESLQADHSAHEIALYELTRQRDEAVGALAAARARIVALETQSHRDRLVDASQKTQISGLEIELADWRAKFGATAGVTGDQVGELLSRLRRSEHAREAATMEAARQLKLLADRDALLTAAKNVREGLVRRLADVEARAKATEAELRRQLQALTTSQATAAGALTVERSARLEREREAGTLRSQLEDARRGAAIPAGDAELRAAIANLGRDVLRLNHGARESVD